jgi:hypothetical protein
VLAAVCPLMIPLGICLGSAEEDRRERGGGAQAGAAPGP